MSDHAGAAKNRRERRLRAWLRHERMTVAMEVHGDRRLGARCEGSRAPEGARAASGGARSVPVLGGSLVGCADAGVLWRRNRLCEPILPRQSVLAQAELDKRKKEEERERVRQEVRQQAADAMERARLLLEQVDKRRKRKKRRNRKLPKVSLFFFWTMCT